VSLVHEPFGPAFQVTRHHGIVMRQAAAEAKQCPDAVDIEIDERMMRVESVDQMAQEMSPPPA
jgi:hypothetical protein